MHTNEKVFAYNGNNAVDYRFLSFAEYMYANEEEAVQTSRSKKIYGNKNRSSAITFCSSLFTLLLLPIAPNPITIIVYHYANKIQWESVDFPPKRFELSIAPQCYWRHN